MSQTLEPSTGNRKEGSAARGRGWRRGELKPWPGSQLRRGPDVKGAAPDLEVAALLLTREEFGHQGRVHSMYIGGVKLRLPQALPRALAQRHRLRKPGAAKVTTDARKRLGGRGKRPRGGIPRTTTQGS